MTSSNTSIDTTASQGASPLSLTSTPKTKKRKQSTADSLQDMIGVFTKHIKDKSTENRPDEEDLDYAKYIAKQLRELPPDAKRWAQMTIGNVMYNAQSGIFRQPFLQ